MNMSALRSTRRAGFTLVELLVVIAIIDILVALLLPAVQSAREAARRTQCLSNIKNIGLALHNFHDVYGSFPPAMEYQRTSIELNGISDNSEFGPNWMIRILPFMEEQPLFDSFVFQDNSGNTVFVSDPLNEIPRGTEIQSYACPSDPAVAEWYGDTQNATPEGANWARGSYAANSSLLYLGFENLSLEPWPKKKFSGPANGEMWREDNTDFSVGVISKGVMGCNLALAMRQISDGTSNTVLVTEVRAGVNSRDRRGVWAMGDVGASSIWGHALGDATGPNSCNPAADNIADAAAIRQETDDLALQRECMFVGTGLPQAAPRSTHPGGLHVCFADASGRFLTDDIDIGDCDVSPSGKINNNCIGTWHYIMASQDGFTPTIDAF